MAWEDLPLITQKAAADVPVRVMVQPAPRSTARHLAVILTPAVQEATGFTKGVTARIQRGTGADAGTIQIVADPQGRTFFHLPRSLSTSLRQPLPVHWFLPVTPAMAVVAYEAAPGRLVIHLPEGWPQAEPITATPPVRHDEVEAREGLAPPPVAAAQELPHAEVPALAPAARKPVGQESPDQLKPEAMQMFAAGMTGRAVADDIGVSLTLVSQWKQEFDLSRRKPAKQRAT